MRRSELAKGTGSENEKGGSLIARFCAPKEGIVMSLKEEIEKIVRAERDKLESRDQGHKEYHERQRKRFQPMRALLEELATSVDTAHLKASIREDSATVEVGRKEGDRAYFQSDARWRIEPNFQVQFHAEKGESLFSEAPGIKVEETVYYRYPEYETFEKTYTFEDEEKAMGYLVGEIAEKVAFYQHLSERKSEKS
jgi:hypothetical protein